MNDSVKVILVLVVAVVLLFACNGVGLLFTNPVTQGQEIGMVQPRGLLPGRDAQFAEGVNLPNSEAELNMAEAHRLNAQATAIIMEQNKEANQASLGRFRGFWTGILGALLFLLFGGLGLVFAIALAFK